MRFGTFGQKFQGVFERVKKLTKGVSKLVQELRKVYKRRNEDRNETWHFCKLFLDKSSKVFSK
jgi:glutathione peroxidase-family protein